MKLNVIPQSIDELLVKANFLSGLTLKEIADVLGVKVPENLLRNKGFVGNLIEMALGAEAGSKAEQDFAHLGVELKTLPINKRGMPCETTFVSLAPLNQNIGIKWRDSHCWHKLQRVLFIPVEGSRDIPLAKRKVGRPILWEPTAEQEALLQQDWEELMELIILGQFEKINATLGHYLQLRPKGANRTSVTSSFNAQGQAIKTLSLGFYLRKNLTTEILMQSLY